MILQVNKFKMVKCLVFVGILSALCQAKVFRFDYEFIEPADGWMKFHVVPSTWREARMRCHAEGAVLASPLTNQLKKAIIGFVISKKGHSPNIIFTGVHATFSKGDYTSIEGRISNTVQYYKLFSYTGVPLSRLPIKWAPGEPDNFENSESCLSMSTDENGSTSDVRCEDVLPYVCYKKFAQLTLNQCGTTDSAYRLEPRTGSCYKFHRRGLVWSQAFMTCLAEGAYLAIINSNVESTVIKEIFAENPDNTIRSTKTSGLSVGFHDWGEHMTFLTIHGETLDEAGFQGWANGQPANSTSERTGDTGEFCGSVFRNGLLNDMWCNVPIAFLCEKSRDSLLSP